MTIVACATGSANAQTTAKGNGGTTNALPGCGTGDPGVPYDGAPPPVRTKFGASPGGVDMRSGTFTFSNTDLSIGGDGDAGLSLTRKFSYGNENGTVRQSFGLFFTHNWDIELRLKRPPRAGACYPSQYDYSVNVVFGDLGEGFRSRYNPVVFQQSAPSGFAELTYTGNPGSNGVYTFTARDGTRIEFLPLGSTVCALGDISCSRASKVVRPDGTTFTLEYDGVGLRSVTSNRGYALLFEIASGSVRIAKACVLNLSVMPKPANNVCPTGVPTATYGYAGDVQTSAVDGAGASWGFAASTNGYTGTFSITRPGETAPYVQSAFTTVGGTEDYERRLAVSSQSFPDGTSYTYNWTIITNTSPSDGSSTEQVAGGSWTTAGKTVTVTYGQYRHYNLNAYPDSNSDPTIFPTPGPISVQDELGRTTTANYCGSIPQGDICGYEIPPLQSTTDPEGNSESYVYGQYRNITQVTKTAKPGSGLANITEQRSFSSTYPTSRAKPTSVTDGNGNVTGYTYDQTHGGVLTETQPAVAVDGAGSVQPVKRYDYVYRKAWISNGAGGYVQNADGVYLLSSEKLCRKTATVSGGCQGANDEVVTAYDYGPDSGPNTLLPRSKTVTAGGVSLRTCYGYDVAGNRIWETSPKGVCP